jgi:hypothetical protein
MKAYYGYDSCHMYREGLAYLSRTILVIESKNLLREYRLSFNSQAFSHRPYHVMTKIILVHQVKSDEYPERPVCIVLKLFIKNTQCVLTNPLMRRHNNH